MAVTEMTGKVRRVGNSLAVLIPADKARQAELEEGATVSLRLEKEVASPLGLLKGKVAYDGPFLRRKEGLWRDRI